MIAYREAGPRLGGIEAGTCEEENGFITIGGMLHEGGGNSYECIHERQQRVADQAGLLLMVLWGLSYVTDVQVRGKRGIILDGEGMALPRAESGGSGSRPDFAHQHSSLNSKFRIILIHSLT